MKSLEHELHCPVCKEIVKQPVVLPCQHSVCLMCASEVLVANGYPPPELPPEPNSPASTPNTRSPRQARPHPPSPSMPRSPGHGTYPGRRRKEGPPLVMMFPCVPCGRDVELSEKGLTDCLRNLTLERIVERYRHTVSLGSVAVMCQFCKPPQTLEATKGCADCRSNFCNECFKLYHPWGTKTKFIRFLRNKLRKKLSKAIENLQHFTLAADPSFRHFQLDVSKELKLLTELNFIQAPLAPVIDTQRSLAYDQLFLCWRLPQESAPAWHFSVEYRRRGVVPGGASRGGIRGGLAAARWGWQRLDEVSGTSAVIDRLEMDSVYVLRVRGCNKAGYGEYSEEVYLHTPPAPVLNFYLDSRWGLHADRLVVSKEQRGARSVPGLSLLQAADHALTSCHLTSDLLVGDVAITQGRHYWACSVEPGSYLVKVGVGLESKLQEWFHLPQDMASPRYDPDSGHDSGAEDALDSAPPFCFLTMGMGKIYLPQHSYHHHNNHGGSNRDPLTNNNVPSGLTYPLPPRLGVCLDFEKGRVTFYDAHSLRPLWEGHVDCSGPVCPAFCFIGGGALQLQELVANRNADQTPVRRVTIQPRVTNLNNNNN
uniref:Tripartite motif containing 46b n=1 Tax=Xiphophorus couchianus TaxID=32473 RepID=A0A3B5MQ44_9TELE